MIANCEDTENKVGGTFFPELFMGRGKPPLESMKIEDGETLIRAIESAVERLKSGLMSMQKCDLQDLPVRSFTTVITKTLPQLNGFASQVVNKVDEVYLARRHGIKTDEERQQEKYRRQSAAKKRKAR